jgi:hypothetical protein
MKVGRSILRWSEEVERDFFKLKVKRQGQEANIKE